MKPRSTKKVQPTTVLEREWIDMDDLVKPGEMKEISENVWVGKPTMIVLDPPEPIKKRGKSTTKRPKK